MGRVYEMPNEVLWCRSVRSEPASGLMGIDGSPTTCLGFSQVGILLPAIFSIHPHDVLLGHGTKAFPRKLEQRRKITISLVSFTHHSANRLKTVLIHPWHDQTINQPEPKGSQGMSEVTQKS